MCRIFLISICVFFNSTKIAEFANIFLQIFALTSLLFTLVACNAGSDEDFGTTRGSACQLLPGDLVITEIQADLPGSDNGQEWFEIYNADNQPISLAGIELRNAKLDGSVEKMHTMTRGELQPSGYFVLGDTADDNLSTHIDYGYGGSLGALRNRAGSLALRCGGKIIDQISYTIVTEGISLSLDGGLAPDALSNDNADNWCSARSAYDADGRLGTPGSRNDACGVAATCIENGIPRQPIAPRAGDLVITEVMANPAVISDQNGEWFELTVTRKLDINNLLIGKNLQTTMTLSSAQCLSYLPGDIILFARNSDPSLNGGLAAVNFGFNFSLTNNNGTLLIGYADSVIDTITWLKAKAGESASLDPGIGNHTSNDNPNNFCNIKQTYNDANFGTPGTPNPDCVFSGECLEGGISRQIIRPRSGDVIFSEFMANPNGLDPDGEWFEIYAVTDFDLNELSFGRDPSKLTAPEKVLQSLPCLPITAASHMLFARKNKIAGVNQVDDTFSFSLRNNGNGALFVASAGNLLDLITWNSVTEGVSMSLDPTAMDPLNNDIQQNWCAGSNPYGLENNQGTPRTANAQCPIVGH